MKNLIVFFCVIVCSFFALSMSPLLACLHGDDIEDRRMLQGLSKINSRNLDRADHLFLETQFQRCLERYWYDEEVKFYYAEFLIQCGDLARAVEMYSQGIIQGEGHLTDDRVKFHMDLVGSLVVKNKKVGKYLESMDLCIQDPENYSLRKKIKGRDLTRVNLGIQNALIEDALEVFRLLATFHSPSYFDATLINILSTLDKFNYSEAKLSLLRKLYAEGYGRLSIHLRLHYAGQILLSSNRDEQAVSVYQSILLDLGAGENEQMPESRVSEGIMFQQDIYKLGLVLGNLGTTYSRIKNFKAALKCYRLAFAINPQPFLQRGLAITLALAEKYEESLRLFEYLLTIENDVLERDRLNAFTLKQDYVIALQLAGEEKKLEVELKKRQKEILRRQAQRNKKKSHSQAQAQKSEEERLVLSEAQPISEDSIKTVPASEEFKQPNKKEKVKMKVGEMPSRQSSACSPSVVEPAKAPKPRKKGNKTAPLPAEKVKTRGVSSPPESIPSQSTHKSEERRVTIEELLQGRTKAYKIFCNLFSKYSDNMRDGQVKISFDEIETLMVALEQDYDPSKGKGSHTKVTLNPHGIFGEETSFDEQMIILARRKILIPAQIDDLRKRFLKWGLYPKELEDQLKEKKLID